MLYQNTQYMLIDGDGNVLIKNTPLSFELKLPRSDDIYANVEQNSILIYVGERDQKVSRYEFIINPEYLN